MLGILRGALGKECLLYRQVGPQKKTHLQSWFPINPDTILFPLVPDCHPHPVPKVARPLVLLMSKESPHVHG